MTSICDPGEHTQTTLCINTSCRSPIQYSFGQEADQAVVCDSCGVLFRVDRSRVVHFEKRERTETATDRKGRYAGERFTHWEYRLRIVKLGGREELIEFDSETDIELREGDDCVVMKTKPGELISVRNLNLDLEYPLLKSQIRPPDQGWVWPIFWGVVTGVVSFFVCGALGWWPLVCIAVPVALSAAVIRGYRWLQQYYMRTYREDHLAD